MLSAWKTCCKPIQQRWVFAVMGFFATLNLFIMRNCLSTAITEIVVPIKVNFTSTDEYCFSNETTTPLSERNARSYEWDEYTQGIILSSFYWGYIMTQVPGAMLTKKFGGKITLGIGMLSTVTLTLITPFMISWGGSTALIVIRVLMGLGEGMNYPALSGMLAQWSPLQERAKIGNMVLSGNQVGTVISSAFSGVLIHYSSMGWPVVFYVFGGCGVVWILLWIVLCYNAPEDHPFVSENEKKYIQDLNAAHTHRQVPSVPWRHIMRSTPVWAIAAATFGHNWTSYTLSSDLPKYMSTVLKFSIQNNGWFSALPHFCMWICSMIMSYIADWMIEAGHMTTGNVRKLGITIASIGSGVLIIAASYSGCDNFYAVLFFTLAMTSMGTFNPSGKVNIFDLSPNYSGVVMGLTNVIGVISGIVTPYIVGVLTPNQTLSEWQLVFWIVLGISLVTNLIYVILASGEVQYWNDPDFLNREKEDKKRAAEKPDRYMNVEQ